MVFIAGAERPARRAGLTRVVRVNPLDPDANTLGFVCDKLLELVEMSRVDTRPRTVFVDAFEVFHPNDVVLELFRERDEATGEGDSSL